MLDKIIGHKKNEVRAAKAKFPLADVKKAVAKLRSRRPVLCDRLKKGRAISIIAEIKRKSPSKGMIKKNFDPIRIARAYERAGASALSVLTDGKFFGGSPQILQAIRASSDLPILRKDFIIDEYQIWESRLLGADCVLLIAAVLSDSQIKRFLDLSRQLGLDALVEVHTDTDADKALRAKARFVGINNRDLRTFRVDLATTERLAGLFSKKVCLVSESGIQSRKDLIYLKACGAKAALVGESLMKHPSPGAALKMLLGVSRG